MFIAAHNLLIKKKLQKKKNQKQKELISLMSFDLIKTRHKNRETGIELSDHLT